MACEKRIDFYLPYPVVSVFRRMAQEPYIAGMKVDQVDYNRYQIFCSKGINLATWGEYITISFFDPQNGGTQIVVESKPKLPTTLVDWGHNEENVRIVMNYFYYLYPPTPAHPQRGQEQQQ